MSFAAPLFGIDRVISLQAGEIRVMRCLREADPFFAGHYPTFPVFPGVFVLETVHQAVRYAMAERTIPPRTVRLTTIHRIRWLAPLFPGAQFEIVCRWNSSREASPLTVEAVSMVDATTVARFKLDYTLEC